MSRYSLWCAVLIAALLCASPARGEALFIPDFDVFHVRPVPAAGQGAGRVVVIPLTDQREGSLPNLPKGFFNKVFPRSVGRVFAQGSKELVPQFAMMFKPDYRGQNGWYEGRPLRWYIAHVLGAELEAHGFQLKVAALEDAPTWQAPPFQPDAIAAHRLIQEWKPDYVVHGAIREFLFDYSDTSRTVRWHLDVTVHDRAGAVLWKGALVREPQKDGVLSYRPRDEANAAQWYPGGLPSWASPVVTAGLEWTLLDLAEDLVRRTSGVAAALGLAAGSAGTAPVAEGGVSDLVLKAATGRRVALGLDGGAESVGELAAFDAAAVVLVGDDGTMVTLERARVRGVRVLP